MSGGSLNYVYGRINDAASELSARCYSEDPVLERNRKMLVKHLGALSELLHDIEWNLSADYGDEDEHRAWEKWFASQGTTAEAANLNLLIQEAFRVQAELNRALEGLSHLKTDRR